MPKFPPLPQKFPLCLTLVRITFHWNSSNKSSQITQLLKGETSIVQEKCGSANVIKCGRSAHVTLMLIRTFESLNGVAVRSFFGAWAPKFHCTTAQVRTQPKYHTVKALNQQLSFDFCQPVYPFEASLTYIGRF
jgi:hypothetical protein